jgi:1,2-dihydroxy-3-keto-5-methylthiopentene dioxygenase
VETEGYVMVDSRQMTPSDDPQWIDKAAEARKTFLAEHTHDDDEDRFFARGAGVFYLHVNEKVHAILCEGGDLLSVPANTTHWFDMGTRPNYVSIRFFHDEEGWVGNFTGNPIAERFPDFDTLMAGR